jgi:hypothetical protein
MLAVSRFHVAISTAKSSTGVLDPPPLNGHMLPHVAVFCCAVTTCDQSPQTADSALRAQCVLLLRHAASPVAPSDVSDAFHGSVHVLLSDGQRVLTRPDFTIADPAAVHVRREHIR